MFAVNRPFTELIDGRKQFSIPIFQRDFCWTREQCRDMWKAVIAAGNDEKKREHFIGSIVYVAADEVGAAFQNWLVIDGQQRLTTLTLLLTALRDCIRESSWSGGDDSPTSNQIDSSFLKNSHDVDQRSYKLVLRRIDNETLHALLDGNDISDSEYGISELVRDCYKFFKDRISEPECNFDRVYRGVGRLSIVDVRLDRQIDNPQLIFESMNSTGVDLSQSDLVRNYLLMGLGESEQTQFYKNYWSKIESYFRTSRDVFDSFLRDYVAFKSESTEQTRTDRVYDAFKIFRQGSSDVPLDTLLKDMTNVARTYASFQGTAPMQRSWLADAMKNMRSLNTTQGLLVMRLYDCHERGLLPQDQFVHAIKIIESYLLRRAVLGMQTRGYWSIFARVAHKIEGQNVLRSLRVELARLRDNNRFPTDEEFKRTLQDSNLYGLRICKHILGRLENSDQREPSPVHEYSIEHIMPQTIGYEPAWQEMLGDDWLRVHTTWLHRLSNLTLTAYNSTYSNRPFHEKKEIEGGFHQSAVRLNQYIRDQSRWTEREMRERGKILAKRALEIWPYHNVDELYIQEADEQDLRRRAVLKNANDLEIGDNIRILLCTIQREVHKLGDIIEVIEQKSVCFYGPEFFAEILPMGSRLRVLLPLDFSEAENPDGLSVEDSSTWKFVPNRVHSDCDLLIDITQEDQISAVMPMVRQALDRSRRAG